MKNLLHASFPSRYRKFLKGLLPVLLFLSFSVGADGAPITRQQARQRAALFMQSRSDARQLVPVTSARRLAPRSFSRLQSEFEPYYVFDRGQDEGFLIVSGDDRVEAVLGYSDRGTFDYEQMPPNMREWLDGYARQLEAIQAGAPLVGDAVPKHDPVPQLMTSTWNQGYPYNMTCPQYFNLGQSITGCVATAMAQILYYNREKMVSETQADMPSYTTGTSHPTYGQLKVDGIPAGSPIDWANMKDSYGSATDKQRLAVADLMHYCGVSVKMDYTNSASGAQSYDVYTALKAYFGFGSSVRYYDFSTVTSDTEWDRIIYADISAGRPIYISGSNSGGGHAFVCDGYDGNLRYHINWGWGGTSDGFYYLTSLTPGQQGLGGSSDGYNDYRQVIVGIEPENYGEKPMTFADAVVRKLCLDNFDANNDGKLTYGEAAEVKEIGTVFKDQAAIKKFSELYYFSSLTAIPDDAFSGCSQLTAIRLPKAVTALGSRAFKDCGKLAKILFPDNVTTVGEEAFSGCAVLNGVQLPDGLTEVSPRLFEGCAALAAMELPVCVTSLGDGAFSGCSALTSFTVNTFHPENIAMGNGVFANADLTNATLFAMQGTRAYFAASDQWKEFGNVRELREFSGGKFADLEAGKKYFIYNVGLGRYLSKGEAWGTQAIVGGDPMRFVVHHTVTMPEGVYYLTSEDTGRTGNYLFRTSDDPNVGEGVMAAFVDGTLATNGANGYWTIQQVADKVYTFQIPANGTGWQEGRFWGVQTDHESNFTSPTYGVYADIDYAAHKTNCQWQFVLYDEQEVAKYQAALALENLLTMATKRKVKCVDEQAVFDNVDSSSEELRKAQRSLRSKLGFVDFASDDIRAVCINLWDMNTDGELSFTEAGQAADFTPGFENNKNIRSFDEFQYFTSVPSVYGRTFMGCTNLESVKLPQNLVNIYYYAFRNCSKLASIELPEYVTNLGEYAFAGCTALRTVKVFNPDPASISLGNNVFGNVPLKQCTLYVPFGSKALFEAADVWKEFGAIVEMRGRTQPRYSAIDSEKTGYVMNMATRKFIAMGEAYGTQSVVSTKGLLYQFKPTKTDSVYYLAGQGGNIVFRTNTDTKVGSGVKTCFGDGTLSAKAYWRVRHLGNNIYTLSVPETDASYVENEYLGVEPSHKSNFESPTYGLYYDIEGTEARSQWVFITQEDMAEAQSLDSYAALLKTLLDQSSSAQVDLQDEQAVYDNPASTLADMKAAYISARRKMHIITFEDSRAEMLCLQNWDSDGDGNLTFDEAAAVTTIGEVFRGATTIYSFEELKYFTGLTEIPSNAFRGASSLQRICLPDGVTKLGDYCFLSCSLLRYLVMPQVAAVVPCDMSGVPSGATVFVAADALDAYQADEKWGTRSLSVYTGIPVVTASASRQYGRTSAKISYKVDGAPVNGEPVLSCEEISNSRMPVGNYPIVIEPGTITTPNLQLGEGLFVITPAMLTVTAKSYERNVGEENPEFEVTYKGFRNRETDTVLTVRPTIVCLATPDSPAGTYEITVSGAEAQNYEFTYEPGTLTVVVPAGISAPVNDKTGNGKYVYDLSGRQIKSQNQGNKPQKGIIVVRGKKMAGKTALDTSR